jgi:hypothetical protein
VPNTGLKCKNGAIGPAEASQMAARSSTFKIPTLRRAIRMMSKTTRSQMLFNSATNIKEGKGVRQMEIKKR